MRLSLRENRRLLAALMFIALAALAAACAGITATPAPSPDVSPTSTHSPTATTSPSATSSLTHTPPSSGNVWENFDPPQLTPVTPIPPPLTGLVIPEEVRVMVIAGADRPLPYSGRTDAIALVIYHPRLARASLVSVPPDLFAYIPGFTMQRMYTAYPAGGARALNSALEYNLGVRPDMYAIFNLNSFAALIDDLGGINVTVLENVREYCPDIPPGVVLMRGEQALCYMRLRLGEEETARNRRQQEVLRTVFLRLVEGGNLVRVPELYERYRSSLDSNLTLDEIMGALPLALKLGDPSRIGFFQMDEDHLRTWQISKDPDAVVFLPNRAAVMRLMQQAIDYVSTPSPLSEVVVTLEYELTISPTPTATFTSTPSPTRTPSPLPTLTFTRTITPTPRPTITRTPTYTVTFTPRPTWSQTPSRAAP